MELNLRVGRATAEAWDVAVLRLAEMRVLGRGENKRETRREVASDLVAGAPVKHLDDTGFRIGGKTQWLHVASTALLTFYRVCAKRGSLLANVTGIIVHDHLTGSDADRWLEIPAWMFDRKKVAFIRSAYKLSSRRERMRRPLGHGV
jgi:hypothetical protein